MRLFGNGRVYRDKVIIYVDKAGRHRWRYVTGGGAPLILADSGQGYSRRIDAENAAKRVVGKRLNRTVKITSV